ncbi:MAG TPA: peptidylprolyl isomerase [Burkholderiales bacterium]|nr:peptidylprolyl isomerase [Burkholderiales bacterium]
MPISVNDVEIPEATIADETRFHFDSAFPYEDACRALAIKELLLQRARETGLAAGRDEASDDAAIEELLAREVHVPVPSEAECRKYYESHSSRFRSGDILEASHILFAVTSNAPFNAIRAKAEETLRILVAEPGRFAELAANCSNCPSGAQGGNLGQVRRGDTVSEFEAALFDTSAVGVLPRLVKTRYGFHIVRIARRIEGRKLPFEMVKHGIAEFLVDRVRKKAIQQYLRILAGKARITGIDLAAAESPLLQ